MFPQFIFLSNPASQYEEAVQSIIKKSRYESHAKQKHRPQFQKIAYDQKFIDSPLSKGSYEKIEPLKNQLLKFEQFDTVVVAPLRKSFQICLQLFENQNVNQGNSNIKIKFLIEPLLCDIVNSTSSIGNFCVQKNQEQYKKCERLFDNIQIIQRTQWMKDILPKRIQAKLPQDNVSRISQQYLRLFESNSIKNDQTQVQTKIQFAQRVNILKQQLPQYQKVSGSNKKVLIIASADMLNHLACTDFHQNGDPVNQLRMAYGEVGIVSLVINGQSTLENLDFESILPFCR